MGPLQTENSSLFVAHKQNWPRTPLNQTRGAWSFPPVKTTLDFYLCSMLEFSEKPFNPNLMSGLNSCFLCCGCVSVFSSLYVYVCMCFSRKHHHVFRLLYQQSASKGRTAPQPSRQMETFRNSQLSSFPDHLSFGNGARLDQQYTAFFIIQLVLPGTPVELFESG